MALEKLIDSSKTVGPPAQEKHKGLGTSPEEGHQDDQRVGEPLL